MNFGTVASTTTWGSRPLYKPSGGFREGFDFLSGERCFGAAGSGTADLAACVKAGASDVAFGGRCDGAGPWAAGSLASGALGKRSREAGAYLRMGNTVEAYLRRSLIGLRPRGHFLGAADVVRAACFATTLRRLTSDEFGLLCRHGFEVSSATLATRQGSQFCLRDTR